MLIKKLSFYTFLLAIIVITFNVRSEIEELNNLNTFNEKVINCKGSAVVKFYAPWCGPCKMMKSRFEESEKIYGSKINFFEVNIDKAMDIANNYSVVSVPTIIFIADGKEKGRIIGSVSTEELNKKIKEYLNS